MNVLLNSETPCGIQGHHTTHICGITLQQYEISDALNKSYSDKKIFYYHNYHYFHFFWETCTTHQAAAELIFKLVIQTMKAITVNIVLTFSALKCRRQSFRLQKF